MIFAGAKELAEGSDGGAPPPTGARHDASEVGPDPRDVRVRGEADSLAAADSAIDNHWIPGNIGGSRPRPLEYGAPGGMPFDRRSPDPLVGRGGSPPTSVPATCGREHAGSAEVGF